VANNVGQNYHLLTFPFAQVAVLKVDFPHSTDRFFGARQKQSGSTVLSRHFMNTDRIKFSLVEFVHFCF